MSAHRGFALPLVIGLIVALIALVTVTYWQFKPKSLTPISKSTIEDQTKINPPSPSQTTPIAQTSSIPSPSPKAIAIASPVGVLYPEFRKTITQETYLSKNHKFSIDIPKGIFVATQEAEGFYFNGPFNDPAELSIRTDVPDPNSKEYDIGSTHGIGSYLTIRVEKLTSKDEPLSTRIYKAYSPQSGCAISEVKIDSIDGFHASDCFMDDGPSFFEHNNLLYEIDTLFSYNELLQGKNYLAEKEKGKALVNQILSTFKFLN